MSFCYGNGWVDAVLDRVDLNAVVTVKQATAWQEHCIERYRERLIELADEYWEIVRETNNYRKAVDHLLDEMSLEQMNSPDFLEILREQKR